MKRYALVCFYLQGGGLYIVGTATLINTNVYSNEASNVCLPSPLPRQYLHRPDKTLRAPLFGSQGGGVYVASNAVANFEDCNIHDNTAALVCSPFELSLNFHPAPP